MQGGLCQHLGRICLLPGLKWTLGALLSHKEQGLGANLFRIVHSAHILDTAMKISR